MDDYTSKEVINLGIPHASGLGLDVCMAHMHI